MISKWNKSKKLINGKACLQHSSNESDLQIFGANGVILQTGPTSYSVIIDNHRTYNRLAESFDLLPNAQKGEELQINFGLDQFKHVYRSIKVPRTQLV